MSEIALSIAEKIRIGGDGSVTSNFVEKADHGIGTDEQYRLVNSGIQINRNRHFECIHRVFALLLG